jgi:hypothetical protein
MEGVNIVREEDEKKWSTKEHMFGLEELF